MELSEEIEGSIVL